MTTTNRAFIKVYRHDAVQPDELSVGADVHPRLAGMPLHASVEYAAAIAAPHARATVGAGAVHYGTSIDVTPSMQQPARGLPSLALRAAGGQRPATVGDRQRANRRTDSTATTKRPLSAFMARQPGRSALPRPVAAKLQPPFAGTTVAAFEWPAACRALAQRCAAELDTAIEQLLDQVAAGHSLVGVVSLFPHGGATTMALCLAARLAARRSVVLVDGNFYHPRLAASLDVVPTAGWQEVLADSASLADSIVRSLDDRLDAVFQSAATPFDPLELAASPLARETAQHLRRAYDLALVDLGAFFDPRSQPVALELARNMKIDNVLAVAGPHPADPRDLATLEEHFRHQGCNLLGLIENRITQSD